jgi:hypothetical protein
MVRAADEDFQDERTSYMRHEHSIHIVIDNDTATAEVWNLHTQHRVAINPDHPVSYYEDGPKWTARDEWLGDFWAKVRDTYEEV